VITLAEVEPEAPASPPGTVLQEAEFKPLLAQRLMHFRAIQGLAERAAEGGEKGRRAFALAHSATDEFVSFLDDHGARSNATYASLAEYAACVRGFAKLGRHLSHLMTRLGVDLPAPLGQEVRFKEETQRTLEFINRSASLLLQEALREASRLAGESAQPSLDAESEGDGSPASMLPNTLDAATVPNPERWIAEITGKFLAHKEVLDRQSELRTWADPSEMREFVLQVSDEQEVRFFTTRIHNVLSRYDTYIRGTSVEKTDEDLPAFRAHVVAGLHVLEVMVELVHFYERHENDVRCEKTKDRVAELVDKDLVLDRILNYCLNSVHSYMSSTAPCAQRLLDRYTLQTTIACSLPEGVSLHARPVALIARIVENYGTPVRMKVGDSECYAGSILQVLMTVGKGVGSREILFSGDREPLEDLKLLFESGLGETDRPLRKELSYLAR